MTYKKTLVSALCFSACLSSHAGLAFEDGPLEWTKVITLTGGPAWTRAGEDQTIGYETNLSTDYMHTGYTSTMGVAQVFFGLQRPFVQGILGQWGVDLVYINGVKVEGYLLDNGVALNSDYTYRQTHGRVSFRGKLVIDPAIMVVQPYLTASAGVAFNHSYGYETLPMVDTTLAPAWFDSYTRVSFVYTGGAGLQVNLNPNWQAGIGYEFSDWGKSRLGDSKPSSYGNVGPQLQHVYVHELLFSLSYLC